MRPFLKWAGGKAKLAGRIIELFPKQFNNYYEPFLGGGAVFFDMVTRGAPFQHAHLSDGNEELIDCYQAVRAFPEDLVKAVQGLPISKEDFLRIRAEPRRALPVERAARAIYLNKTCFNGLYRVNAGGKFNVPWGNWKKPPKIVDVPNIYSCSAGLNRYASLYCEEYRTAVESASEGDVVYMDPPYVPASKTSNFDKYTSEGFGEASHQELAKEFEALVNRGVAVVLSNSDTELVRDLYFGYEMHSLQINRSISAKASSRKKVGELIIVGRRQR